MLLTSASVVGLVMIGVALSLGAGRLCDHPLPRGVSSPSLALELAGSPQDVAVILGQSIQCARLQVENCLHNRTALYDLQARDFWFIPVYAAFLGIIALIAVRDTRRSVRTCGILALVSVLVAAVCDVRENVAIRALLQPVADCSTMPRPWAVAKWSLLCLVMLLNVPVLLDITRVVVGVGRWAAVTAIGTGLVALAFGARALGSIVVGSVDDGYVESAAPMIFSAIGATWVAVTAQRWFPRGLMAGFEDLARWPPAQRLANWPNDD